MSAYSINKEYSILMPRLDRGVVIAACVIVSVSIIISIVGCFVDGLASDIFTGLQSCVSSSGSVFGDSAYTLYASQCAQDFSGYDCYCIFNNLYTTPPTEMEEARSLTHVSCTLEQTSTVGH